MKWSEEAKKALDAVPFFVRGRVRKRVEEEAVKSDASEVRLEHLQACQRHFLSALDYYTGHCAGGERLGEIMEKRDGKNY